MVDEFIDVTKTALGQANQLLDFLVARCNPSWKEVLIEALSESELELNIHNVTLALKQYDITTPYGAVLGGTGVAKVQAGLEGEDTQKAVKLLKHTGRLLQAGKGRGKALVILNRQHLIEEDFAKAIAAVGLAEPKSTKIKPVVADKPDDYIHRTDTYEMLHQATTNYRLLISENINLTQTNASLNERINELEAQLARAKDTINDLEIQIQKKDALSELTSWS